MKENKSDLPPEDKLLTALFGGQTRSTQVATSREPGDAVNADIESVELYARLSILADSDECEEILKDILERTERVQTRDDRLLISVRTESGTTGKLVCSPPVSEDISVPDAYYRDILRTCGGLSFPDLSGAAYHSECGPQSPAFLNGGEVFTMFSPENEAEEAFTVVIDTHQDWFVLEPEAVLPSGKPAVAFLSHAGSGREVISRDYSIGGHYLRLIARTILGAQDPRLKLFRNL